jgi:HPt (histidine-containing phosphotransfer) domain-containing protein
MSAPHALIEFFQQEAVEYLDRLEQLLEASENACPDASAFLTHARALRGSAAMTRLDGLADLASTVERVATGLRDSDLRWDQRLHFAVHGALVELRDLVLHANEWGESEQRRSRTQSVALAAVASGYLAVPPQRTSPSSPVVPISRFFPDDGLPGILERNPQPPFTLPQRFRTDIAAAGAMIAREAGSLESGEPAGQQRPQSDGVRRALLALGDVAESYGATSIAALAVSMARAPLVALAERAAVQSLSHLLQDRERTDGELAAAIKDATLTWPGRRTPAASTASPRAATPVAPTLVIRDLPVPTTAPAQLPPPAAVLIPIETLLYAGQSALERARVVRDELRSAWTARVGVAVDPVASALLDELSDLLDLAVAR